MHPDHTPSWWDRREKSLLDVNAAVRRQLEGAKDSLQVAHGVVERLNKESEDLSRRLDGALADARGSQKDTDTYWKKRAKRAEAELRTNSSRPVSQRRALEERIVSLVQTSDQTSSENVDIKKYNAKLYKENVKLKDKLHKIPLLVEATNVQGTTDVGLAKETRIQNVAFASCARSVVQTGFRWAMPVAAIAVIAVAAVTVLTQAL